MKSKIFSSILAVLVAIAFLSNSVFAQTQGKSAEKPKTHKVETKASSTTPTEQKAEKSKPVTETKKEVKKDTIKAEKTHKKMHKKSEAAKPKEEKKQ